MKKLNKYQKLNLILYGICLIYFSIIRVPFYTNNSQEIVYDSLFSSNAYIDTSRLLLILAIITTSFVLVHILAQNFKLDFRLQHDTKLKLKIPLLIIISISIIGIIAYYFSRSDEINTKSQSFNSEKTASNGMVDIRKFPETQPKPIRTHYKLGNISTYTDKNFKQSVTFSFINTSDEVITNVMFQEAYFLSKNKENNYINKQINLSPNDSIKFTFRKNYDGLYVYKIRFSSGKSITLVDRKNDLFDTDNMIYSKLFEK